MTNIFYIIKILNPVLMILHYFKIPILNCKIILIVIMYKIYLSVLYISKFQYILYIIYCTIINIVARLYMY